MQNTDSLHDREPSNAVPTEELLAELRRLADDLEKSPSMNDMAERGEYSPSTYQSRFGSWSQAKEEAGVQTHASEVEYTDADLLADLREFADQLGKTPTKAEMRSDGPHSPSTYASRFGSWTDALREADLDARDEATGIPEADLAAELRRVADEMGRRPTSTEFDERGAYSASTYFRRFGSWQAALEAAGVADSYPAPSRRQVTDGDLFDELERMANVLGRPPTETEMSELGDHSPETYRKRFGSWHEAISEAGLDPDLLPTGGQKRRIPVAKLVVDVQRVAEELGRPPTYEEIQERGRYGAATYLARFGTWNRVLEAADLEQRRYRGNRIPDRELVRELRNLALALGGRPRRKDMEQRGPYSGMTYYDRFGSWVDALSAAGIETRDGAAFLVGHCDACGRRVEEHVADLPGDEGLFCDGACRAVGTQSTIQFESGVLASADGDHVGRLAAGVQAIGSVVPSRILFALRHAIALLDSDFESAEVGGHQFTTDGESIRVSWASESGPSELLVGRETVRRVKERIDAVEPGWLERPLTGRAPPVAED